MAETKSAKIEGTAGVRAKVGQVVRIVCTVIAAIIALSAIVVALRSNVNDANPIVQLVTDVARIFDGPFGPENGIFQFDGANAVVKEALVNWGIAAVVWLLIGRLLDRLIRP